MAGKTSQGRSTSALPVRDAFDLRTPPRNLVGPPGVEPGTNGVERPNQTVGRGP